MTAAPNELEHSEGSAPSDVAPRSGAEMGVVQARHWWGHRTLSPIYCKNLRNRESEMNRGSGVSDAAAIDIQAWVDQIKAVVGKVLPRGCEVSADPPTFFDGFDGEGGYPKASHHPLWEERGIVVYVPDAETFKYNMTSGRWERFNGTRCQRIFFD